MKIGVWVNSGLFLLLISCFSFAQTDQNQKIAQFNELYAQLTSKVEAQRKAGNSPNARVLARDAVAISKSLLEVGKELYASDDTSYAELLGVVAFVEIGLADDANRASAINHIEEAIEIIERTEGDNSSKLPRYYHILGNAKNKPFEPKELSKSDYRTAIKISSKVYGEESLETADMNRDIGGYIIGQTNYADEGMPYIRAALDIYRKLGENNPTRLGIAAFNYGKVLRAQGRNKTAIDYFVEALETLPNADPGYSGPLSEKLIRAFLFQTYVDTNQEELANEQALALAYVDPLDMSNSMPTPIYRVRPEYPEFAAQTGAEGYVVVRFVIDKEGKVRHPVIEESTSKLFEKESLKTILKNRYTPRLVDGQPVDTPDALFKFTYLLER